MLGLAVRHLPLALNGKGKHHWESNGISMGPDVL